jgi:hypothetical protein
MGSRQGDRCRRDTQDLAGALLEDHARGYVVAALRGTDELVEGGSHLKAVIDVCAPATAWLWAVGSSEFTSGDSTRPSLMGFASRRVNW